MISDVYIVIKDKQHQYYKLYLHFYQPAIVLPLCGRKESPDSKGQHTG